MKPWLLKRWRRRVGLVLLPESGASRRVVRLMMGRPDGLLYGGWFYWRKLGSGILIGFNESNEMTGSDMLWGVKEAVLTPFPA